MAKPTDDKYWIRPWSSLLLSGDVFQAIPFANVETELLASGDPEQHFQGPITWGYGLLISPTCDMYEEVKAGEPRPSHPFRVFVPIVSLDVVLERTKTVEKDVGLMRKRDGLTAYTHLPELKGQFPESLACLYIPSTVSLDFLAEPPRRVAQMDPEARRHLKVKLAAYWGRINTPEDQVQKLPLRERGEEATAVDKWPPSPFDMAEPQL